MKNFQTLNKKECREASIECFHHAESKYKDALLLASAKSYGNGISNLILCLEETMKGLILSLDADEFQFRSKVKGIKGLFENHKLRYFLGFVMSGVNLLFEDLIALIAKRKNKSNKSPSLTTLQKNTKFNRIQNTELKNSQAINYPSLSLTEIPLPTITKSNKQV